MNKVTTNRKTTRGRNIYYQTGVPVYKRDDSNNEIIQPAELIGFKTIKHIQVSNARLKTAESMIKVLQEKHRIPEPGSERTQQRKLTRQRGILVWNSYAMGTYVKPKTEINATNDSSK